MKLSLHSTTLLFALGCYPNLSLSEGDGTTGLRKLPAKPKTGIECDVQLAVGQVQEEGPPQEILHCNLDEPDDLGYILYEIQGLVEHEFLRIKDKVTSAGATRYEFPGATRSKGKPAHAANLFGGKLPAKAQSINVPKPTNGKPQAIEKGKEKEKGNNSSNNNNNNGNNHRSLYNLQGVSTVLAVRVVALDAQTTKSENDCRVHTFGGYDDAGVLDDMNMKSQIDDCSYGKLKFVEPDYNPTYPDVVGGLVTVTLNQTVTGVSHGTVLGWLREATPDFAGPLDQYDHVMYFMPPGVAFNGAAAFGYVPGRETWYMDSYSLKTGIQLHELGHNLGLGHAGEDGGGYGDSSCYMGYGGGDVKMCYNAAKSWYLGWYEEFHQEFDPLKETSKLYQLVGLSDYTEALASSDPSAFTIVLRIETYESESLYLTYNRQKGVNIDVKEFQDKVTVVRANGRSQSWVEAGLAPGQKYSRAIVHGSGIALEIVVCDRFEGSPDYATVSVHPFGDTPLCTPQSPIPSWNKYNGGLQDGLVAHYKFDNDFLDTSGNRFHAFEFGNPTFISDDTVSGQALSFDGIDDYVELPKIPELDFGTSDFTITFWYRVSGDQVGRPAIIGNKDWRATSNPGWVVSSNYGSGSNGDDLAINLSDGTTTLDGSKAIDVAFNRWHFVAVRVKRGETMSLLRSNLASYALQEDEISALTGSLSTNFKIRIGTSHEDCGASFTKMDMDDLAIWSRALASEEVEQIWMSARKNGYNALQAHGSPNSNKLLGSGAMVAKYDFENDYLDSTSNDLSGLLSDGGGASFVSSTDGYYMNINNVDFAQKSFVTLPSSSLLDFGTDTAFTVAVWLRTSADFSSGGTSIVSNKDWASGRNPGWTLGVGSNGRYEWNVGDGSSRCDYDGPAGVINDGLWHHVAFSMTRGANGKVTLYVDGKIVSEKTCVVGSITSVYPINIGADGREGAGWYRFYTGDVDKAQIFASALEHVQIFELYSQGRSSSATFAPSPAPTLASETDSPTMRPTASPVTASPTAGPSGPFFIRNPSSGKVITIDAGICTEGTNIIPGVNEEKNWQKWMLNNDNTIESVHCPGMVFGFEGTQCGNSVSVVLRTKSTCDDAQAWILRQDGVVVNSKCDTKAVDIAAGSNIILWSIHAGNNQLWELVEAAAPPSLSPTTANPATATPTLAPTKNPTASPVTSEPTASPVTSNPTPSPITAKPTLVPTTAPTDPPTKSPTASPVTSKPTDAPVTADPTLAPTAAPTDPPTKSPTASPVTSNPTVSPSATPTMRPTASPVTAPPTLNADGPFFIRNPSSGKLLTIDAGCTDGTNILPGVNEENSWQQWMLNDDNTIESVHCPGMVMGFEGTQCGNSVSVVLRSRNSSDNGQAWALREDGVMVNSKCDTKALDIAGGANIILWSIHGGNNQLWEYVRVTESPTLSPTISLAPTASPDGPFYIKNPATGKLITIDGGVCGDGTNIILSSNDTNNWQKWMIKHDNTIESVHCPGMVMGFEGSVCGNLVSVVLSPKIGGGSNDHAWIMNIDTAGIITSAKCNSKSIDIMNGSSSDGANLILYSTHSNWNQMWEFVQ